MLAKLTDHAADVQPAWRKKTDHHSRSHQPKHIPHPKYVSTMSFFFPREHYGDDEIQTFEVVDPHRGVFDDPAQIKFDLSPFVLADCHARTILRSSC